MQFQVIPHLSEQEITPSNLAKIKRSRSLFDLSEPKFVGLPKALAELEKTVIRHAEEQTRIRAEYNRVTMATLLTEKESHTPAKIESARRVLTDLAKDREASLTRNQAELQKYLDSWRKKYDKPMQEFAQAGYSETGPILLMARRSQKANAEALKRQLILAQGTGVLKEGRWGLGYSAEIEMAKVERRQRGEEVQNTAAVQAKLHTLGNELQERIEAYKLRIQSYTKILSGKDREGYTIMTAEQTVHRLKKESEGLANLEKYMRLVEDFTHQGHIPAMNTVVRNRSGESISPVITKNMFRKAREVLAKAGELLESEKVSGIKTPLPSWEFYGSSRVGQLRKKKQILDRSAQWFETSGRNQVMGVGRYQGLKFSEIPISYLVWFANGAEIEKDVLTFQIGGRRLDIPVYLRKYKQAKFGLQDGEYNKNHRQVVRRYLDYDPNAQRDLAEYYKEGQGGLYLASEKIRTLIGTVDKLDQSSLHKGELQRMVAEEIHLRKLTKSTDPKIAEKAAKTLSDLNRLPNEDKKVLEGMFVKQAAFDLEYRRRVAGVQAFRNEYAFLSNFAEATVKYEGDEYPTVEHAYQAAKSSSRAVRQPFMSQKDATKNMSPEKAKKLGGEIVIDANWEERKVQIMDGLLRQKFSKGSANYLRLKATSRKHLTEGNTWGDQFWGVSRNVGQNKLGQLLMAIRGLGVSKKSSRAMIDSEDRRIARQFEKARDANGVSNYQIYYRFAIHQGMHPQVAERWATKWSKEADYKDFMKPSDFYEVVKPKAEREQEKELDQQTMTRQIKRAMQQEARVIKESFEYQDKEVRVHREIESDMERMYGYRSAHNKDGERMIEYLVQQEKELGGKLWRPPQSNKPELILLDLAPQWTKMDRSGRKMQSWLETVRKQYGGLKHGEVIERNASYRDLKEYDVPNKLYRRMAYTGIGSRETPLEIQKEMTALARELGSKGFILRSGGARGADMAFEEGAKTAPAQSSGKGTPYQIFQSVHADENNGIGVTDEAIAIAKKMHPTWARLDDYTKLLMARNAQQVLGYDVTTRNKNQYSRFLVCWTPDGAEKAGEVTEATGDTGQAIRIANAKGIKVFNLQKPRARERLARFLEESSQEKLPGGGHVGARGEAALASKWLRRATKKQSEIAQIIEKATSRQDLERAKILIFQNFARPGYDKVARQFSTVELTDANKALGRSKGSLLPGVGVGDVDNPIIQDLMNRIDQLWNRPEFVDPRLTGHLDAEGRKLIDPKKYNYKGQAVEDYLAEPWKGTQSPGSPNPWGLSSGRVDTDHDVRLTLRSEIEGRIESRQNEKESLLFPDVEEYLNEREEDRTMFNNLRMLRGVNRTLENESNGPKKINESAKIRDLRRTPADEVVENHRLLLDAHTHPVDMLTFEPLDQYGYASYGSRDAEDENVHRLRGGNLFADRAAEMRETRLQDDRDMVNLRFNEEHPDWDKGPIMYDATGTVEMTERERVPGEISMNYPTTPNPLLKSPPKA